MLLVPGIICIFNIMPVWAETQQTSLSQLIDYAMKNNGNLKAYRVEKGIREAAKVRAGLLPNPVVEFDASTGALTGSGSDSGLGLGISQELLLAGKRDKRRNVADREMEVYQWQLEDQERLVRAEVKFAFFDTMLATKRIDLANRAIELNRQLLEITKDRLAAGDIPELEMNLVKVELARSEGTKNEVNRALRQSQSRLFTIMGVPIGETFPVSGIFDPDVAIPKSLDELKRLAHEHRPDLKSIGSEKNRGEADILLAQAEKIPNLTAGLVVRRDTSSMEIGGVEGKDTAYTVGLKLSIPIPVFDKNQAGIQEATAKRNSAETRQTALNKIIGREVDAAFAIYQNSGEALALYKSRILPQLEENLKLTQEAYRLGEVGILAVIQEQKKFYEVNDSYLVAIYDHQISIAKLESTVGTELTGGVK